MSEVVSCAFFKDNAELIGALLRLGYLDNGMKVLDPTYGGGKWWTGWKPKKLTKHDLVLDGVDFRNLPHRDSTFDFVAFDPPYVSIGGRASSELKEMYDAYGLLDAPTSPKLLQRLINNGLEEMYRVTKPEGIVVVKCQDYISSGKLWSGTFLTEKAARSFGFHVEAKFIHAKKKGGPQPKNRTRKGKDGERVPSVQKHPRNNASLLIVLRVPKKK